MPLEENCNVRFRGYQQDFTWMSGAAQFKISAEKACAPKWRRPFELKGAKFEIRRFGKVYLSGESPFVIHHEALGKWLIFYPRNLRGNFPAHQGQQPLVIDSRRGHLSSPSGLFDDLKKIPKRLPSFVNKKGA